MQGPGRAPARDQRQKRCASARINEAAAYALRIDVAEELARLATPGRITRLLDAGGELGKRLDFLIRELHRRGQHPGR